MKKTADLRKMKEEYPFTPHYMYAGKYRMHYVDEGTGPVIIMLHACPMWSFFFRNLIKEFSQKFRVIAPDAIGYASLASIKDTVKALNVDGVTPSEATVKDGSYVIQRPFVLVTKTDAPLSTAAQAFFDYATSTAANDLIKAAGAVPVAK